MSIHVGQYVLILSTFCKKRVKQTRDGEVILLVLIYFTKSLTYRLSYMKPNHEAQPASSHPLAKLDTNYSVLYAKSHGITSP